MEPEKCDEWFWTTWEEMRASPLKDGSSLFLPITNLLRDYPKITGGR
jgi:hypothetical protein